MAKESIIQRNKKREILCAKYCEIRKSLKNTIRNPQSSQEERAAAVFKLQKLPRDSSRVRVRQRCAITGRPRGVFKRFGICRHKIRELGSIGYIPGLKKASW